jgi:hypothetical protein
MNMNRGARTGWMMATLAVAGLLVSPAFSAGYTLTKSRRGVATAPSSGIGSFTPASADPKLAAAFARSGLSSTGFRFTPASTKSRPTGVVKVAVRSRSSVATAMMERVGPQALIAAPVQTVTIAPVSYNLGVALGWKRFALSGDVIKSDTGVVPGGREGASLGVSYSGNKWSSRVQVEADRPLGNAPRSITGGESIALDVGGSYTLARNLNVTAGVRYKSERDRLQPLADNRRDSQAVYIGTAFKF